jgi:hypothetical protein
MPSRALNQPKTKPRIQVPERKHDWQRLLQQAIRRAEQLGDRRLPGLRVALGKGESEQALRRLGIIHDGDILREFPDAKKAT